MSGSMFQLESSNIQNILIALVVICAIVYGFIEFRKVDMKLELLESKVSKVIQSMEIHMVAPPSEFVQEISPESDTSEGNSYEGNTKEHSDPLIDKIINQVESDVEQGQPMVEELTMVEEPKVEEPNVEEPKVEEPNVEEPKVEEPNVEELTMVEEPKVEEPKVEESMKDKGIFVSVMTKPNTINITEDERIVELDGNETTKDVNTSYVPNDSKDPILEVSYDEYTIKELKTILEEKGLSTSGSKTKLIERILSSKK